MKTRVRLKDFVNDYLWKQFFASNLTPYPFKLDFFDNFANFMAFDTVLT